MKIRMVTVLVAGSIFGLPITPTLQSADAELRVRRYDRFLEWWTGCVVADQGYLQWRLGGSSFFEWTMHEPWIDGTFVYQEWLDTCSTGLTNYNQGQCSWNWPCCENQFGNGYAEGWQWQGDIYGDWYYAIGPYTQYITIPWERCAFTNRNVMTNQPSGIVYTNIYRYGGNTTIDLLTGGEVGVTNEALFKLTVSATNGNTGGGSPISPGQLTALGKTAIPEGGTSQVYGVIFKKLQDHQTLNATVEAPGSCYTFGAQQAKATLRIVRGGTNLTGGTQVTWAGVGWALTVELTPAIANLSNIVWSIPGNTYSGFYISSPPGAPTNSWPVEVTTLTNETVIFGWATEMANAVVNVTAQAGGETLTAQVTFVVRYVDASWTAAINNTVHVANQGGVPYLRFGEPNLQNAGMLFTMSGIDLKGFEGSYSFATVQIGAANVKMNLTNGTSVEGFGAGLDSIFPNAIFGQTNYGQTFDSPSWPLDSSMTKLWRDGAFTIYLLWKPDIGWPVTVRYISWDWSGNATNQPPWTLGAGNGTVSANNVRATGYPPSWGNNILNRTWTTNGYWLP